METITSPVNPNPAPATPDVPPVAHTAPVDGVEQPSEGGVVVTGAVDVEALREQLAAAQAEVESARRHCQQRDNEMQALKRKAATDPEAIAALEEELKAEAEAERQRLLEEAEAAKQSYIIKSNTLDVKQTLADAGVSGSDATKLASFITCEDSAESTARAKAIVSVINKVAKAQADAKAKEATNSLLAENAEVPPNGSSAATATKAPVSRGALAAQRYVQSHINNIGGTN